MLLSIRGRTIGYAPKGHLRGVTKMIEIIKGCRRAIDDFILTQLCLPSQNERQRLSF